MFNDKYGLTAAVLRGEKTQTRRDATRLVEAYWNGRKLGDYPTLSLGKYVRQHAAYNVGDVVAVAQSYEHVKSHLGAMARCIINPFGSPREHPGWTNKMFVKAELMPCRIKITRVRLQLLQDISDEDCLNEGVIYDKLTTVAPYGFYVKEGIRKCYRTPQDAFWELINRVSGKGTWERNPYVLAYTFEVVR